MTHKTAKKVMRYETASNESMKGHGLNGVCSRNGSHWYVIDLLTTYAVEKDSTKGWFRTRKTCQRAADKLNRADGGRYVALVNGFVAVAHSWSQVKGYQTAAVVGEESDEELDDADADFTPSFRKVGDARICRLCGESFPLDYGLLNLAKHLDSHGTPDDVYTKLKAVQS